MKKYVVFAVIVALFMALPAQAQFNWGLKAGVSLSNISSDVDYYKNTDSYTGFNAGLIMEYIGARGVGMDMSLLYSQTGFKLDSETVVDGKLLIPVNLKYKLSLFENFGIYGTAGPYIGFRLWRDDGKFDRGVIVETIKSQSLNAGLNFGAGFELLKGLQIVINYQLGLTDDYKLDKVAGITYNDAFNSAKTKVWSVTAALFF